VKGKKDEEWGHILKSRKGKERQLVHKLAYF
jgi:hypothetical protein